jgi:protein TonB
MSDQAMVNSSPAALPDNYALWVAIAIAVLVHIVITLEVELAKPEPETLSRDIDITLITTPSEQAPEKAQFLAQDNQLASGQQTSNEPLKQIEKPSEATPAPPVKPVPKPSEKVKPVPQPKPIPKVKPVTPAKPVEKPQPVVNQKIIASNVSEEKIDLPSEESKTSDRPQTHQHLSAAILQQQIMEQAAQTVQRPPSVMQTTTVKSVNQVSANKSVAAQYKRDWDSKVERVGNRNYPEVATKPGFSASLTMDVDINLDGSIENIRITHSSGIPELDEAAKKIVQMSAPFPPLPAALRSELDVLKITRVWKFSDESGLITQ